MWPEVHSTVSLLSKIQMKRLVTLQTSRYKCLTYASTRPNV